MRRALAPKISTASIFAAASTGGLPAACTACHTRLQRNSALMATSWQSCKAVLLMTPHSTLVTMRSLPELVHVHQAPSCARATHACLPKVRLAAQAGGQTAHCAGMGMLPQQEQAPSG